MQQLPPTSSMDMIQKLQMEKNHAYNMLQRLQQVSQKAFDEFKELKQAHSDLLNENDILRNLVTKLENEKNTTQQRLTKSETILEKMSKVSRSVLTEFNELKEKYTDELERRQQVEAMLLTLQQQQKPVARETTEEWRGMQQEIATLKVQLQDANETIGALKAAQVAEATEPSHLALPPKPTMRPKFNPRPVEQNQPPVPVTENHRISVDMSNAIREGPSRLRKTEAPVERNSIVRLSLYNTGRMGELASILAHKDQPETTTVSPQPQRPKSPTRVISPTQNRSVVNNSGGSPLSRLTDPNMSLPPKQVQSPTSRTGQPTSTSPPSRNVAQVHFNSNSTNEILPNPPIRAVNQSPQTDMRNSPVSRIPVSPPKQAVNVESSVSSTIRTINAVPKPVVTALPPPSNVRSLQEQQMQMQQQRLLIQQQRMAQRASKAGSFLPSPASATENTSFASKLPQPVNTAPPTPPVTELQRKLAPAMDPAAQNGGPRDEIEALFAALENEIERAPNLDYDLK